MLFPRRVLSEVLLIGQLNVLIENTSVALDIVKEGNFCRVMDGCVIIEIFQMNAKHLDRYINKTNELMSYYSNLLN